MYGVQAGPDETDPGQFSLAFRQVAYRNLFRNRYAEYAEKVASAYPSDLIWCEAGLQHRIHSGIVKSNFFVSPCRVRTFADALVLLTRAKAVASWGLGVRALWRRTTRAWTVRARAGRRELRVCTDANMIDTDDIDQRADISCILYGRIGQMCPNSDQTPSISDDSSLLLADESRTHQLRHARVATQLRLKAGVRDDDRPSRDLERAFRRLQIGMRKIDKHTQPIAFLDRSRPERGQSAIAGRICVNISQRYGSIAVVKQSEMSQTALVGFFHTPKVTASSKSFIERGCAEFGTETDRISRSTKSLICFWNANTTPVAAMVKTKTPAVTPITTCVQKRNLRIMLCSAPIPHSAFVLKIV